MNRRDKRAREIQNSIREVLIREWDPVNIQDVPEAQDEYDGYVGGVYRLLVAGASESVVARFLRSDGREFSILVRVGGSARLAPPDPLGGRGTKPTEHTSQHD